MDGDGNGSTQRPRFAQVYDPGWDKLDQLLREYPSAGRVYVFLAKNAGSDNSVACTVETIAEAIHVHPRTVLRATKWLDENDFFHVEKLGTANLYILNAEHVWKTYSEYRKYSRFKGNILLQNSTRRKDIKTRRLTKVLDNQKTLDLMSDGVFDDDLV